MAIELFCRLYLQTDLSRAELIAECGRILHGRISGSTVETLLMELDMRENKSFDYHRFRTDNDFVFARYSAEIEPKDPDTEKKGYIESVCELISSLRRQGVLVFAACKFEDEIVNNTGWNWTFTSREHPKFDQ